MMVFTAKKLLTLIFKKNIFIKFHRDQSSTVHSLSIFPSICPEVHKTNRLSSF